MAFVRGLMGPYMRPIPVGASAAMLFSLIVAFVVSPWAALRLLRHYASSDGHKHETEGWTTRFYRRIMNPLILKPRRRWLFLASVVVLLLLACSLVAFKLVKVKMLPFDNKSEFQVIVDMPNGTTLEQTTHVAQELGRYLGQQPEVLNYEIYSGTSGPFNFNGLVRHYFLRRGANQADIQVNLLNQHERRVQSHEIAKRLRPGLVEIGNRYGARLKVAEVPPGPPVLQTLVAEIYGPDYQQQVALAKQIKHIFQTTPGVVDVDWYVEDPQTKYDLKVDLDKAALHGIAAADISKTMQIGLDGATAGLLHVADSREDIPIRVQLGRADRSSITSLEQLRLPPLVAAQVSIGELTELQKKTIDTTLYRKNLLPVAYVLGDVAGEEESPVYAIEKMNQAIGELPRARWLSDQGVQRRAAHGDRSSVDEVGWRVAHHHRGLSRSWPGLCRRAGSDLRAGRRLVPFLHHPAGDHGAHSTDPRGHSAGACADGRLLHRDLDDWLYRRCRHHRAQFDHPG